MNSLFMLFHSTKTWETILLNAPFASQFLDANKKLQLEECEKFLIKEANEFITILKKYQEQHSFFVFDEKEIRKAYIFAYAIHAPQRRQTGEQYISHPEQVTIELLAMIERAYKDVESLPWDLTPEITIALLHDTVEDAKLGEYFESHFKSDKMNEKDRIKDHFTEDVRIFIEKEFPPHIAPTVFDMVKTSKNGEGEWASKAVRDVQDLLVFYDRHVHHKLFIEEILKLSDRIHNLLTLEGLQQDKIKRIMGGTLITFVPMALRLGLHELAKEIEEVCLQYILNGPEYDEVKTRQMKMYNRSKKKEITALTKQYSDLSKQQLEQIYQFGYLYKRKGQYYISIVSHPCFCEGLTTDLIYEVVRDLTQI